jgi:Ser/Thr protein kinase RdoA (MazF antagonist)
MRKRLREEPPGAGRRWEVPETLRAEDEKDYWIDTCGGFWRAMRFIDSTVSFDTVRDIAHAREVGHALAAFHRLLSDLPHADLYDTLEGFHITPGYLLHYDGIVSKGTPPHSPEIGYGLRSIEKGRGFARVLEQAKSSGTLRLRPIHGDPKVNNVLFDAETGKAAAMIDLDTAKPGLIQYDLGDCLRSCCNPLGEAPEKWETVRFEPDLCRAVLEEYMAQGKAFLTPSDYDFLFDAMRLIPFELGLRFFTDYLEGNVYFKTRHPEHNLHRALVQFRLAESVESQERVLRAVIRDLK